MIFSDSIQVKEEFNVFLTLEISEMVYSYSFHIFFLATVFYFILNKPLTC